MAKKRAKAKKAKKKSGKGRITVPFDPKGLPRGPTVEERLAAIDRRKKWKLDKQEKEEKILQNKLDNDPVHQLIELQVDADMRGTFLMPPQESGDYRPIGLALSYENRTSLSHLSKGTETPTKTAIVRNLIPSLAEAMALQRFWSNQGHPSEFVTDALHICFMQALEKEMINDPEHPIGLQLAARKQGKLPMQLVNVVCSLYAIWSLAKEGYGRYYTLRQMKIQGKSYWMAHRLSAEVDFDKQLAEELSKMEEILNALKGGKGSGKEVKLF